MRARERLDALIESGVIDEVVRPLMSGKEAEVFLVISEGEERVAKVYKEAQDRSFRHRSTYTEGRRVRNTRQQRAMDKRSRYGRAQQEAAWREAEVDAIYQLRAAGVWVPEPYAFIEGVLIMELIRGFDGEPAPRLADVTLSRDEALWVHDALIREVVRMLCAGLVHGDLSDFNVLMSPDGPILIDFPQVIDAAANRNARRILIRDVDNLKQFLGRFAPKLRRTRYGPEIWALYESGQLTPDSQLTGRYRRPRQNADAYELLDELFAAQVEENRRRAPEPEPPPEPPPEPKRRRRRRRRGGGQEAAQVSESPPAPAPAASQAPEGGEKPRRRRRRRRRRRPSEG